MNAIVDEEGELVKTFDYEEFGGPHPASVGETYLTNGNAENNKLLFAGGVGHPADSDSGLVYMRARYYDPASGALGCYCPYSSLSTRESGRPAERILS